MMRADRWWALPLSLALFLAGGTSGAWGQCGPGKILPSDAIELRLMGMPLVDPNGTSTKLTKTLDQVTEEKKTQTFIDTRTNMPLAVATATLVEAPSSAAGGSEVSLPGLASLLALAQEQGLVNSKDGVTTVSLTPFSFLALIQPKYNYDQELYESVRNLRHWGGTISFGGKGDSFDRDGDGKPDEALQAKDYNDIVTWEAKYQIGSRDRRDRGNFETFDEKITSARLPEKIQEVREAVIFAVDGALTDKLPPDGCASVSDFEEIFKRPDIAEKLKALKQVDEEYKTIAEKVFKQIDNEPIFTLVFGGTQRADGFGPDKRMAAVRGAFTWLRGTNSTEASWSRVENLLGGKDPTTLKLGWQYSRNFLKGTALSKDGVTLAVAGSHEKYYDVPTVTHDTVSKVNAKISVPVTEGVSIPVSVTWANHKDLLTGEAQVQGHIGFTVDYSVIQEQLLGKKK